MNREAESQDTGATSRALVPVQPPRLGRFASWLQRVMGPLPPQAPALPPGLDARIDELERRQASLEEDTRKRLDEAEGRILHRTQQRFETLEQELGRSLRQTLERELEERIRGLRMRLTGVALVAIAAAVAAAFALFRSWPGSGS